MYVQDKDLIRQIAEDYCNKLMRDIRTVKKMKHQITAGTELADRYNIVRYEDYIRQARQEMDHIFDYLQVLTIKHPYHLKQHASLIVISITSSCLLTNCEQTTPINVIFGEL